MDFRSRVALDWERLLSLVSLCATSEDGKRAVFELEPLFEKNPLDILHNEVKEWGRGENLQGKISFESFKRVQLNAPKGIFLSIETFRTLKEDLRLFKVLRDWLKDKTSEKKTLLTFFNDDEDISKLGKRFDIVFDERGEISDYATPTLFNLRREKEKAIENTSLLLKKIMDKLGSGYFSQENPTIINGRLVLPVVASKKRAIDGIELDSSSTGSTIYLEPFEAVSCNNILAEFDSKEREEIKKILLELTEEVMQIKDLIENFFDSIVHFDTILARARFSSRYKGIFPEFSENGEEFTIVDGSHPLLLSELNDLRAIAFNEKPKKPPIPLGLRLLIKKEKTLILSGPNGGGKTVALKTAGLLSMMNQSGIPIPVKEGSFFPFFEDICAVIGDIQSISDDSSTFTARMSQIADELKNLKEPFLFLIDELNSGTDPTEGSVLSKEIVSYIHKKRGYLILSTHDEALKAMALSTKGMVNAGFGFSEKEGKPTYILKMGVVGKSRALDMALKANIPEEIIESARKELPEEGVKLSNLLKQFEEKVAEIEKLKDEMSNKEKKLEEEIKKREKAIKDLEDEKLKILRELPNNLKKWREEFLKPLKVEVNLKSIRKVSKKSIEDTIEIAGKELNVGDKIKEVKKFIFPQEGSFVKVSPYGFEGRIKRVDEGRNAIVLERDGKEITVGIGDVEVIDEISSSKRIEKNQNFFERQFIKEIMLIGKSVADALDELDFFVDKSYLEGVEMIRIVHGTGSGKLRSAIREYLKKDKRIAHFESASQNQGGEGVTLAKIKG